MAVEPGLPRAGHGPARSIDGDDSFAAGARRTPALRRLFQLWRVHGMLDLTWMLRDARAVTTFIVADILTGTAAVSGTLLLAVRFNGLGRWSANGIVFMLGYALLVTGIPGVLFNYNVAFISRRIGRGQLDHTLLQPQPLWMALLTEGFAPFSAAMQLLPGGALLVWAVARLGITVTPGWLALLALNLAASATIALAFSFLWGSLAFWAPRAAEEINNSSWHLLDGLKSFPLDGVGAVALAPLLSVVPIGFLAWYPARALLGLDSTPLAAAVTPAAALAACVLTLTVFRRGLRRYARTGSSRYLSFGHRR